MSHIQVSHPHDDNNTLTNILCHFCKLKVKYYAPPPWELDRKETKGGTVSINNNYCGMMIVRGRGCVPLVQGRSLNELFAFQTAPQQHV